MRLHDGTSEVVQFPTKRSGLILARLALSRNGTAGRDDLAETLWPEDYLDATKVRLRQELKRLRDALGAGSELVQGDRTWIKLDLESCVVDVREFDRKYQAARAETDPARRRQLLESALEVCGGPLLPEYSEDWVLAARQESRARQILVRVELSDAMREAGDTVGALESALAAVRQEPLHEPAVIALIRGYQAAGDPAGAHNAFQDYERALQKERRSPSEAAKSALETAPVMLSMTLQMPVTSPAELPPLPTYQDHYFGRAEDRRILREVLGTGTRLITLVGPGGVGKTRLAVETVKEMGLPAAFLVADEEPHDSLPSRLTAVADTLPSALIVLDNVEPVVDLAADAVRQLMAKYPNVRVLATSRQQLGLAGERFLPLDTMAPPPVITPETLEGNDSTNLFLDRVRQSDPSFTPSPSDLPYLAMLLTRLDGLPLAIELAAARVSAVGLKELAAQADERFTWLVTKRRDLPHRQRSLWAAIETSYSALDSSGAMALKRLSHFRGGFPSSLATAVLGPGGITILEDLYDRSLIAKAGTARFRMLESISDFARKQESEEESERNTELQATAICDYLYPPSRQHFGSTADSSYRQIGADFENAAIAVRYACERGGELAARLGTAIWRYGCARGNAKVTSDLLVRLGAAPDIPLTLDKAEMLLGTAIALRVTGSLSESARWYDQTIAAYDELQIVWGAAWAKLNASSVALAEMRCEDARRMLQEAMDSHYSKQNIHDVGMTLAALAIVTLRLGRTEEAVKLIEESLAKRIQSGDEVEIARGHQSYAWVKHQALQTVDRLGLLTKSVTHLRANLIQDFLYLALCDLTEYFLEDGQDVTSYLSELDELVASFKSPASTAFVASLKARDAVTKGERDRANDLFSEALSGGHRSGDLMVLSQVLLFALEALEPDSRQPHLGAYAFVRDTHMPETPRERQRREAMGEAKPDSNATVQSLVEQLLVTFATR